MANYYITNDPALIAAGVYNAPNGVSYDVINSANATISVTDDSTFLIDKDVSGKNFTFKPQSSTTSAQPTVEVEAGSTGGGNISFNNTGAARLQPTVKVPDGVVAPNKRIDLGDTENATLEVGATGGTGARIGKIIGSSSSNGGDTITLGDNVTISGDIDLNRGDDAVTAGDNVRIEGFIYGDGGNDSVTLGDSGYVGNNIQGGTGNDSVVVGDYMKVDGSGIDGDQGNDYIETGSFFQADGGTWQLYGGYGDDTINIANTDPYLYDTSHDRFWVAGGLGNGEDVLQYNPTDTSMHTWLTSNHGQSGTSTTLSDAIAAAQAELDAGTEDDTQIKLEDSDGNKIFLVEFENTQPCFTRGTLIETDRGEVAIEDLVEGDLVRTRDNGLQPIRWIGARALSAELLAAHGKLQPIRIQRGALGRGVPSSDLLVSPQHRVLVRSAIAQKMFGTREVLVAAKQLCQVKGIDVATDVTEVEYFHLLFDRHEVVFSNGAETESLFTGPEALKSVGPAAQEEIFAIFPELRDRDYRPEAARLLTTGRKGRQLAVRHKENRKALVS